MSIWVKDGKLVVDENGKPIECEDCPCDGAVQCDTACCETGAVTNTVEIDFGMNILTDDECSSCNEVGGVFELESSAPCVWTAEFDYECGSENTINCGFDPSRNYNGYRLSFSVTLNATFCNLSAGVSATPLMDGVPVGLVDPCEFGGGASYFRNGAVGTNKIACDEPFVADLVSSGGWGNFCGGNFPATVTLTFV
jgi:hypothetical protein